MSHGRKYTDEMRQFILENYKGVSARELADRLNAKFGTDVTPEQMKSYKGNHKLDSGLTGCFCKGMVPHNKGKKMPPEVYEKVKHTMFKKGQMPTQHRPVGSERISVDGYLEIKVEEPRKWRLKSNVVWEQHNGKIPKGSVIMFLDGNKLNVAIENLKLIKRSELLVMNRYNLYGADAESTEVATNLAKLIDTTKKRISRRCCHEYKIGRATNK